MIARLVASGGRIRTTAVLMTLVGLAVVLTAAVPASASAATKTNPTPLLAEGAGMGSTPSPAVRSIQRVLDRRGYDLGAPGVDGRFGPLTAGAVRRFQADYGLAVDGVVGPKTRRIVRLVQRRAQRADNARREASPNQQAETEPATPDRAAAQPAPQAAPEATVLRSQDNEAAWLLAVAASAALGAFLAAFALRWPRSRRGHGPILAPLMRELYVEGHSADRTVGEFRGHALATAINGHTADKPAVEQTSYLVDDLRKKGPVWVRGSEVTRRTSRLAPGSSVIGYVTMSPDAPANEADEPAREIEKACSRSKWQLLEVITDRENGVGTLERPGLSYALEQIAEGRAGGLVVSDMRRLGHSIVDLGALMEWFCDSHAALIALDLGVDTSTPSGRELAAKLIRVSGWERERVSRRTPSSVGAQHQRGETPSLALAPDPPASAPSRLPAQDRPALVERIIAMRASNMTLQAIADQLNAEGVPTLRGGAMWRPSSVQAALGYRRPGSRPPREQIPPTEDRRD
jgi:DNA invertase Pin-like site-specific DNA recombinase/peptidoglycan hydrolase-like protein with peptidoglycan-binding domain